VTVHILEDPIKHSVQMQVFRKWLAKDGGSPSDRGACEGAGDFADLNLILTNSAVSVLVPGELIESRGDWSLVQPSTVPPPLVRIERFWCHRSVNSRLWQASFQPGMRSMAIIVMLKIEQLRLEIGGRPE
jgi:hypothetical protein